jgi:hypothetical protein
VAGTARLLTIRGGVQGVQVARLSGSGQAGKIIEGKIMDANEPRAKSLGQDDWETRPLDDRTTGPVRPHG